MVLVAQPDARLRLGLVVVPARACAWLTTRRDDVWAGAVLAQLLGRDRDPGRSRGRHPARRSRPPPATPAAGGVPSHRGLPARQQGRLAAVRPLAGAAGRARPPEVARVPRLAGGGSAAAVHPLLLLRRQRPARPGRSDRGVLRRRLAA